MLNFFLQLGPPPTPPPYLRRAVFGCMGEAIPFLVAGSALLVMLFSVLLRYTDRVRDWWASKVLWIDLWVKEHERSDQTKGGKGDA